MGFNKVETVDERVAVRHVILSVSDKTGLAGLAAGIASACPGVKLYSTGGTYGALCDALGGNAFGTVVPVSEYTGQPEMQGGLVKTLDWRIYLGLLAESRNPAHEADLSRYGAVPFDMVVSNLYPFEEAVARPGAFEDKRQHIDIGGPCMVRAAAKNFLRVAVLSDPADYPAVIRELSESGGSLSLGTRLALSRAAFERVARYDASIAAYMGRVGRAELAACYDIER